MSSAKECSPQQLAFCEAYVLNGRNGKQAAIAAGFAPQSAHVRANKLLKLPRIQALIAELTIGAAGKALAAVGKKEAEISAKEENLAAREEIVAAAETIEAMRERVRGQIINRLCAMGFTDMGQLASWTEQGVQFIPSAELTPEQLAAVGEISAQVSEGESQDGKTLYRNVNMRVKPHDPLKAMKELARLLELGPKKEAATSRNQPSAGVVVIVAGGPTGLELAATQPIAVVPAPSAPEAPISAPTATPGAAAPAMRAWNPTPRTKRAPATGRAIVSAPTGTP